MQVQRESEVYERTLQKMNQQLQASLTSMAGEKNALLLSLTALQDQFEGMANAVYTAEETVVGQHVAFDCYTRQHTLLCDTVSVCCAPVTDDQSAVRTPALSSYFPPSQLHCHLLCCICVDYFVGVTILLCCIPQSNHYAM